MICRIMATTKKKTKKKTKARNSKVAKVKRKNAFRSYDKAMSYIFGMTDYERQRILRYNTTTFDLGRMERLLKGVSNPHKKIETVQRYPAPAVLPGPKFAVGWIRYHISSVYDFLLHIAEDTPTSSTFEDGVKIHEVIDAAYQSSREGKWVSLE